MSDAPVEILLVEDDPGSVRLTSEGLKERRVPHNLTVAEDGVAAMEALRRQGEYADAARPDLILLDLNLPKKDGREVLTEIEGDPDLNSIPVVVLTASNVEEDVADTLDHGARFYITKPVDLAQFLSLVDSIKDFLAGIGKLPPE